MTENDILPIREIERKSFPELLKPGTFLAETHNPTARWICACAGERVVGYLGIWILIDEMHVMVMAVEPAWRRRSVGRALLIHAIGVGRDAGACRATLEVRRSNIAARRLYEEFGFVVSGLRPGYYLDDGEDALLMWIHDLFAPECFNRLRLIRNRITPPPGAGLR